MNHRHDIHDHDPMVIRLTTKEAVERDAPHETHEVQAEAKVPEVIERTSMHKVIVTCGLAVAVVALVFLYMWSLYNARVLTATHAPSTQAPVAAQSEADIVAKVGTLILLPSGETPVIATVSNLDALKGQPFFENARIGDIVLMYKTAARAILYDPSLDKIIEVAPITGDMKH